MKVCSRDVTYRRTAQAKDGIVACVTVLHAHNVLQDNLDCRTCRTTGASRGFTGGFRNGLHRLSSLAAEVVGSRESTCSH